MRPKLVFQAAGQGGIFTRSQARAAGYTERELKSLTRPGGDFVVVSHGVYVERVLVEEAVTRERFGPTLPEHLHRFADVHAHRTGTGLWTPAALDAAS